jgi:hypothetical protein
MISPAWSDHGTLFPDACSAIRRMLCSQSGRHITVVMSKSGGVGADSRSSENRFGSTAEGPVFRRSTVTRRINCRPLAEDRRR